MSSGALFKRDGLSIDSLVATLVTKEDPIAYLVELLEEKRVPAQGRFFYSQTITGLAVHTCIIVAIFLATFTRWRNGQLWFTRRQQQKLRLNATVITMLFAALYSLLAIGYTCILLYQQHKDVYLPGSAAYQLSCWAALSVCIAITCYTYHQSLPVGFDGRFIRRIFGRTHAATDTHVFDFPLLCIWLVVSIVGSTVAPVIHDYWRREADRIIVEMMDYLQTPATAAAGLLGIANLRDQVDVLQHALDQSVEALRIQTLVYLGHVVLYTLLIGPVAWKLVKLLDEQIASLRRSADDFFRLGSRAGGPAETNWEHTRSQIANYATAKQPHPAQVAVVASPAPTATVTCHNCQEEVAIAVHFQGLPSGLPSESSSPNPSDKVVAFQPSPVRQKPRPHFKLPAIPPNAGADFPLVRAKKLLRVRMELVAFSSILLSAMVAFIANCVVMYVRMPHWDGSTVVVTYYTICFWNYAIPGLAGAILYVYVTLTMPRPVGSSSAASTPTSEGKTPFFAAQQEKALSRFLPKSVQQSAMEQLASQIYPPSSSIQMTKRTQPTFPRAPSSISLSRTTEVHDVDSFTEDSSVFVPPVPVSSLSRGSSLVKKWVTTSSTLAPPQPATAHIPTRTRTKSMAPVSQTQSWLDINED